MDKTYLRLVLMARATIPAANYAIERMGKRTGVYEAVFSNDVAMFRPGRIKQLRLYLLSE